MGFEPKQGGDEPRLDGSQEHHSRGGRFDGPSMVIAAIIPSRLNAPRSVSQGPWPHGTHGTEPHARAPAAARACNRVSCVVIPVSSRTTRRLRSMSSIAFLLKVSRSTTMSGRSCSRARKVFFFAPDLVFGEHGRETPYQAGNLC